MSADLYLLSILAREGVDTSATSPVRGVIALLRPIIAAWAGTQLVSIEPSGSFAKGTANHSGTDIDLFISLKEDTTQTLKEICEGLFSRMTANGYTPRRQNVSIHVRVPGYDVDLVPARRQGIAGFDHSLYRRKADTWTKTNVQTHILQVLLSGRSQEIRILKLWRNQKGLDFPSFYLELTVIAALASHAPGTLSERVWKVFQYLQDSFTSARVVDPANTNNVISEDLTVAERQKLKAASARALAARTWEEIVV